MPSPEHAADLERVLTRAAEECESGGAWFGEGLPQALKSAIDASGKSMESAPPLVAFVEAGAAPGGAPGSASRVVALSTAGLDELPVRVTNETFDERGAMLRSIEEGGIPKNEAAIAAAKQFLSRLDFTPDELGRHDQVSVVGFNDLAWTEL